MEAASCASDLKRSRKSALFASSLAMTFSATGRSRAELRGAVDHAHAALPGHAVDAVPRQL